jgi:hypothetical protein
MERILDTRDQAWDGDACNVLNSKRREDTTVWVAEGYHS